MYFAAPSSTDLEIHSHFRGQIDSNSPKKNQLFEFSHHDGSDSDSVSVPGRHTVRQSQSQSLNMSCVIRSTMITLFLSMFLCLCLYSSSTSVTGQLSSGSAEQAWIDQIRSDASSFTITYFQEIQGIGLYSQSDDPSLGLNTNTSVVIAGYTICSTPYTASSIWGPDTHCGVLFRVDSSTNTSSSIVWAHHLTVPNVHSCQLNDVVVDPTDGTTISVGRTGGDFAAYNAGSHDFIVFAVNAHGDELYRWQFGTSSDDQARAVAIDPTQSQSILVAGFTSGGSLFDAASQTSSYTPQGGFDIFVVKLNTSSLTPNPTGSSSNFPSSSDADYGDAITWIYQAGTNQSDYLTGMAVHASTGDVYITGESYGYWDGIAVESDNDPSSRDVFIMKLDSTSGSLIWRTQVSTTEDDQYARTAVDSSGNIALVFYTSGGVLDSVAHIDEEYSDQTVLLKFDGSNGNRLWGRRFGRGAGDIVIDSDDNIIVSSSGYNFTGTPNGGYDCIAVKFDTDGSEIWRFQHGSEADYDRCYRWASNTDGNLAFIFGNRTVESALEVNVISGTDTEFVWTDQYRKLADDQIGAVAVDQLNGNSIAVVGYTGGQMTYDFRSLNSVPFAIMYNSAGGEQWRLMMDTQQRSYTYDAHFDQNSDLVMCGTTYGWDVLPSPFGSNDFFAAKIDAAAGTLSWVYQNGSDNAGDSAYGIATDSSNAVVVVGHVQNDFAGTGSHAGSDDIFVLKLSSADGSEIWRYQNGTSGSDSANGVAIDTQDRIIVCGTTSATFSVDDGHNGNSDMFVLVLDSNANEVWRRQFGSDTSDYGNAVVVDTADDSIIIAGRTYSSDFVPNSGGYGVYALKLDLNGDEQFRIMIPAGSISAGFGLTVHHSTGEFSIGASTSNAAFLSSPAGNGDIFVVHYNSSGSEMWRYETGTTEYDTLAGGLGTLDNGEVVAAGYTAGSFDGIPSYKDGFVMKITPPAPCTLPANTTCDDFQPDPPVVTFSDTVVVQDAAVYRIQVNASLFWDQHVRIVFPDSSEAQYCDYPNPSGQVEWRTTYTSSGNDECILMLEVDIPMQDFLGKCGFEQVARNQDSELFQQTVSIETGRSCLDARGASHTVTRETQYVIEVVAPSNATASVGGLEVFGTAFKLDLLGDLTITPDIDTNMPTISGFFVTETQHPYELQDPVFELTGDFNYPTFELTGTYCTADNSTRLPCQQTWSYSFQPNQTCPDKAQLEGELVQVTWNVNCSDGFIGECAPAFAVQPEATFTLNSPIYCFSSDYIELTPALEVYQFDQLTANSADFGASNLGTLTDNGFSVERVFTIDSQLYAEFTVVAAGTGVTLTATTLKKVSTTTSSRGELVLYETNAAEQVITQATTFSVHDTGFGTGESSDFADYRTRFEFTWLNDTTVLLDSTEDLAQTIALSATAISIFTNVQSLRKAGIDERHPILSKLNSDQHAKEQQDNHMILFANDDEPRQSKTTVLARLAPASTTNTPAASTASSGFVVSPTVAAAGIALIAVVALVAFAVIRRGNDNASKTSDQGQVELQQLQACQSITMSYDHHNPIVPSSSLSLTGSSSSSSSSSMITLQQIATSYNNVEIPTNSTSF
jgi:hypothetical protein